MNNGDSFNRVLEAIERLPADQQADLLELVRRRLAERGRQRIAEDAREARAEHERGRTRPASAEELMDEIDS